MILTVSLNPSIDKSVDVLEFDLNTTNIVSNVRFDVGGKGINVASALKQLGCDVKTTGFSYKNNSELLISHLKSKGIPFDFVTADGVLRTNLKVYDKKSGKMIEINEPGSEVTEKDLFELKRKVRVLSKDSEIVAMCGSVPKGVPTDIYLELSQEIKKDDKKKKLIIDASGEFLLNALKAAPFLIKPNIFELEKTFNMKINSKEEIVSLSKKIIKDYGVKYVCVSMGGEGAVLTTDNESYFATALKVDAKGLQGAGDSMVAGFCKAITDKKDAFDMLRYAVASATGSVSKEGTLLCELSDFEKFLPMCKVEKM